MKKLLALTLFALVALTVPALAQDSTAVDTGGIVGSLFGDFDILTALACAVGIYEVVITYYPTVKNYSLLTLLFNIIRFIAPNRKATAAGGGTHK